MALFKIDQNNKIKKMEINQFVNERELQRLCEKNLEELFQVRFVDTEFKFGDNYNGRLDTIGIDYDGNPVIIEYKLDKNQAVLSQSLFYMDWLVNHRGDFEVAAKNKLGNDLKIVWDNPKMIIFAQDYNKYDKYAVNRIEYDIYLYKYVYYKTGELYLENINVQENRKYYVQSQANDKDSVSNKYQRKDYDFEYHLNKGNDNTQALLTDLNEFIVNISDQIEVRYPQNYIGYRTTRNFAEVQVQKNGLRIFLMDINYNDPEHKLEKVPDSYQWVLTKQIYINDKNDLDYAMNIIKESYESTL